MQDSFNIKGKTVIVTGASSGMGRAISLRFAKAGAVVIASARREEPLKALAKEVAGETGRILPFVGDITDDAVISKIVKFAIKEGGGLDTVVANAGIMDNFAPIEDITDKMWENVMNVNVTAPMKLIREAMPALSKSKHGGSVIVISSVGGFRGGPAGTTYVASKHAVIGLMKSVAFSGSDDNVRCNAICPGAVETGINESMGKLYPEGMHQKGMSRSMKGMNLVPRTGRADEIAAIAHFLASDEASIVNGATITADGGWSTY